MTMFLIVVQGFLRIFGVFWIVGGVLIFFYVRKRDAKLDQFLDHATAELEQALDSMKELGIEEELEEDAEEQLNEQLADRSDQLTQNFMVIGTALTFLSGLGLVLAKTWVLIPLCLSLVSQLVYFALKYRLMEQVTNEEDKVFMQVQASTRNAFKTTVMISALSLVMVWTGYFQ